MYNNYKMRGYNGKMKKKLVLALNGSEKNEIKQLS